MEKIQTGHVNLRRYIDMKNTLLYIIGVINGQYGFFRSDDAARSWVRINDDAHQYGLVLHICGDMQEHGRVYVGTHGRGLVTGIPE